MQLWRLQTRSALSQLTSKALAVVLIFICGCGTVKMESPTLKNLVSATKQTESDIGKLELVNQFFNNRIRYDLDSNVWGVKEYWATPDELIEKGVGDCDDYALAKYFILKDVGLGRVLKLVYGRLLTTSEPPLFLLYDGPQSLVLDNKIDSILTLQERSDLLPILGFNHVGLWTFHRGTWELLTTNSKRLVQWRELLRRLKE